MPNTNIKQLYGYILQQMAAESYFEQNKLSGFVAQMKFLAEKYRNSEKILRHTLVARIFRRRRQSERRCFVQQSQPAMQSLQWLLRKIKNTPQYCACFVRI